MLHHIHHHKHGIKQTVFAFMILAITGGVLYIGANQSFFSKASEITTPTPKISEGEVYMMPSFDDTEKKTSTNPDAKTTKAKAYTPTRPKNLPSFMVKSVVDGNIVVIENDQRVRLAGIKSPEKDEEWGIEAAEYLKKMINKRQIFLQLDSKNPEDAFGRLRGVIYLDNKNINIEMLKAGLAHVYVSTPSMIGVGDWENFEKEAATAKKGLWSDKQIEQKSSGSIIDKLKDYFFPSTTTKATTPSKPSSYDSFLNTEVTEENTPSKIEQNSTSQEKTLPTL